MASPIASSISERIKVRGDGWVFSPVDFVDLGNRNALDEALSRMAADGSVRRVARGLYDVPRRHPLVGSTAASIDQVAEAFAGKSGARIALIMRKLATPG